MNRINSIWKTGFFFVMAVLLQLFIPPPALADYRYASIGDYGYEFETSGHTARVYSYSGSSSSITIPSTVNYLQETYTVVGIASNVFKSKLNLSSVVIPDTVLSIDPGAFASCSNLTSVNMGNGVSNIGMEAFKSCSKLPAITLSNRLTEIGSSAFSGCTSLTSITLPATFNKLWDGAFQGCSKLTAVNVIAGNQSFSSQNGVLFNSTASNLIVYPMGKTDSAYTIPDTVTGIGVSAFQSNPYLTGVTIGSKVASIDKEAFYGCSALGSMTVVPANPSFTSYDGVIYSKPATTLLVYPVGKAGSSFMVPLGVTTIGYYAFSECKFLNSVVFPDSVTAIQGRAFKNCLNLRELWFSGNKPTWDTQFWNAFEGTPYNMMYYYYYGKTGWSQDTYVKPYLTVTYDANGAASGTSPVDYNRYFVGQTATLKENSGGLAKPGFVFLGWSAFKDGFGPLAPGKTITMSTTQGHLLLYAAWSIPFWYTIENGKVTITKYIGSEPDVVIPSEINGYPVTTLPTYFFSDNTTIKTVYIPDTLTEIPDGIFDGCTGLTDVSIGSSVASIGYHAFKGCSSLDRIDLPASVTSIDPEAFVGCSSLRGFTVNQNNKKYSAYNGILYDREQTTLVSFPGIRTQVQFSASVTGIGNHAFHGCKNLTSITLPDTISSIGSGAFEDCDGLTSFTFPPRVENIGWSVFEGCSNLTRIDITGCTADIKYRNIGLYCDKLQSILADQNDVYFSDEGVLYKQKEQTLIFYPPARKTTEYKVLDGTKAIDDYAFYSNNFISFIGMPKSLLTISPYAFENCSSLQEVSMGHQLTSIGGFAFYKCGNLTSVTFPDTLSTISISAFNNCSKLIEARFLGDAPILNGSVFNSVAPSFKIYYYAGRTGFSKSWDGHDTEEIPISSLTIKSLPQKTDYVVGENLVLTGLSLAAAYTDGFSATLSPTMDNISGFDSSKPATGQVVTVTVGGKSATFIVNIKGKPTVSFESNGGSPVGSQTVELNGTASEPAPPEKTDCTFIGWYSDIGLTSLYDFTSPVTGNLVLYAKWKSVFPSKPTGLKVTAAGDAQVSLSWSANSEADLTIYKVGYMPADGVWSTVDVPWPGTTCTVEGLTNGILYTFKVSAVNTEGKISADSDTVTAVPQPAVATPVISLTSPTAGSSWTAGESRAINWTSTGVDKINIFLQKGGEVPQIITTGVSASAGSYSWNIPGTLSAGNYQIHLVSASDSAVSASSGVFAIVPNVPPASITISSPSAGVVWTAGDTRVITWTSTGIVGNINILLLKNGADPQNIATGVAASAGTYSWNLPSTLGTGSYQIKLISTSNDSVSATSSPFAVIAFVIPANIIITNPNSGSSWQAGTTRAITWSSIGSVGNINIELLKSGAVPQNIVSGVAASAGTYSWNIPKTLSAGSYQIKLVSASDNTVSSTSSTFNITSAVITINAGINISSPAKGATWITETKNDIKWTYTGKIDKVNILLLKDGALYQNIGSTTAKKKKYSWTIPATFENGGYQVKIVSIADDTVYGTSGEFAISAPVTSLTLVSPAGETRWEPESTQTIKWSFEGKINKLNILLMQGDVLVQTIASTSAKKKSYKWKIPGNTADGTYQIKIINAANAEVYDISENITIAAPPVTLNLAAPKSGDQWKINKSQTIKWNYTGSPGKINVSLYKGDMFIKQIGSIACKKGKTSGSCKFKPPASTPLGDDYNIIITSTNKPDVSDESGEFSIIK